MKTILFSAPQFSKTMKTLKTDWSLEWITIQWIHAKVIRLYTHRDIWVRRWTTALENTKSRWGVLINTTVVMLSTTLWHASVSIAELAAVNIIMKSLYVSILEILSIFTLTTGSVLITILATHISTNPKETSTSAEISTPTDSFGKTIPAFNSH